MWQERHPFEPGLACRYDPGWLAAGSAAGSAAVFGTGTSAGGPTPAHQKQQMQKRKSSSTTAPMTAPTMTKTWAQACRGGDEMR